MRVAEATVTTLHQDDPLTDFRQIGNNMLALIIEDLRSSRQTQYRVATFCACGYRQSRDGHFQL